MTKRDEVGKMVKQAIGDWENRTTSNIPYYQFLSQAILTYIRQEEVKLLRGLMARSYEIYREDIGNTEVIDKEDIQQEINRIKGE